MFRLCVVVIDELLEHRDTLPLRLLGRGATFRAAMAEAVCLPADDPLRNPLLQAILHRRHTLEEPHYALTPDEEEFRMHYDDVFLRAQLESLDEGRRLGVDEGRRLGRCIEARMVLMRLLARRGFQPDAGQRATMEACEDLALLESWIDKTLDGTSVANILGMPEPSPAVTGDT